MPRFIPADNRSRVSIESSFNGPQLSITALEEAAVRHPAGGHGWLARAFAEGEYSVATTPPRPLPPPVGSREPDWGNRIEPSAKIMPFVPDEMGSDIEGIGRHHECLPSSLLEIGCMEKR